MTFEAFEVVLGQAVRSLENALKAADLARDDVDADAVMVDGQEWRKCLAQQPQTSLSALSPITMARTLYRPTDGASVSVPQSCVPGRCLTGVDVLLSTTVSATGSLQRDRVAS